MGKALLLCFPAIEDPLQHEFGSLFTFDVISITFFGVVLSR